MNKLQRFAVEHARTVLKNTIQDLELALGADRAFPVTVNILKADEELRLFLAGGEAQSG